MTKQFCDKLISGLEKGLRSRFASDEEMARFADYDLRAETAPSVLEELGKNPDSSVQLKQLSEDPKGQLSAVREVLHLMADRATKRMAKAAAGRTASRQEELVA